jgi:hypothetical protein
MKLGNTAFSPLPKVNGTSNSSSEQRQGLLSIGYFASNESSLGKIANSTTEGQTLRKTFLSIIEDIKLKVQEHTSSVFELRDHHLEPESGTPPSLGASLVSNDNTLNPPSFELFLEPDPSDPRVEICIGLNDIRKEKDVIREFLQQCHERELLPQKEIEALIFDSDKNENKYTPVFDSKGEISLRLRKAKKKP